MITTGGSSDKYGACEVCQKHTGEMFHQIEERHTEVGWTAYRCHNLFGCHACLMGRRR